MKIRIQKFLAKRGVGSRRQIEEMIRNKRIKINNKLAELGMKVDENDRVEVDNKLVEMNSEEKIYIMFNKPKGVLSTCRKSMEKGKTVLDYIDVGERIYPVGRLDKGSEGILLLTNDGDLALKLTHPKYGHEKEYLVEFQISNDKLFPAYAKASAGRQVKSKTQNPKIFIQNMLKELRNGVDIGGYITRKSTVRVLTKNSFLITLREGKNRQIRRMCEAVGLKVLELKRVRVGKLKLGDLKIGEWRRLRNKEIEK